MSDSRTNQLTNSARDSSSPCVRWFAYVRTCQSRTTCGVDKRNEEEFAFPTSSEFKPTMTIHLSILNMEHLTAAISSAAPSPASVAPNAVKVCLSGQPEVWKRLREQTNEMVACGRKMLPRLQVHITGLKPASTYWVALHLQLVHNRKWKLANGKWSNFDSAKKSIPVEQSLYMHPHSPMKGRNWNCQSASFEDVRLKSYDGQVGNIKVHLNHKYVPRILLFEGLPETWQCTAFPLPDAEFIAVSNYHNNTVRLLKSVIADKRTMKSSHEMFCQQHCSEEAGISASTQPMLTSIRHNLPSRKNETLKHIRTRKSASTLVSNQHSECLTAAQPQQITSEYPFLATPVDALDLSASKSPNDAIEDVYHIRKSDSLPPPLIPIPDEILHRHSAIQEHYPPSQSSTNEQKFYYNQSFNKNYCSKNLSNDIHHYLVPSPYISISELQPLMFECGEKSYTNTLQRKSAVQGLYGDSFQQTLPSVAYYYGSLHQYAPSTSTNSKERYLATQASYMNPQMSYEYVQMPFGNTSYINPQDYYLTTGSSENSQSSYLTQTTSGYPQTSYSTQTAWQTPQANYLTEPRWGYAQANFENVQTDYQSVQATRLAAEAGCGIYRDGLGNLKQSSDLTKPSVDRLPYINKTFNVHNDSCSKQSLHSSPNQIPLHDANVVWRNWPVDVKLSKNYFVKLNEDVQADSILPAEESSTVCAEKVSLGSRQDFLHLRQSEKRREPEMGPRESTQCAKSSRLEKVVLRLKEAPSLISQNVPHKDGGAD